MKNELQIHRDNMPELVRIQRHGVSLKDASYNDIEKLQLRIFRILGLVEKDEEEATLREEIAIEAILAMRSEFKSMKLDEVIKAYQLATMNKLGLKDKVRTLNANTLGDVLSAYQKYRSEQTKVFRRKEQELLALQKPELPPPLKSIEEIAEEVKTVFIETGKIDIQFYGYWAKIWFYFYEMPPEEAIPFMEKFRKKAELIVKSERVGTFSRHMEISEREIKIKMAELSLMEIWQL